MTFLRPARSHRSGVPLAALALLVARVWSALTTVVLLVVISRTAGPQALGSAALGMALGGIVATVSDAGMSTYLVRESARESGGHSPLWTLLVTARVVAVAASAVAIGLIAPLLHADTRVVAFLAIGLVLQQAAELPRSSLLASGRPRVAALHSLLENTVWIGAVLAARAFGMSLARAVAVGAAVMTASWLFGTVCAMRSGGLRFRKPSAELARSTSRALRPFAAFAVVGILYSRLDALLLARLLRDDAVVVAGAYVAAQRLLGALELIPDVTARAAHPELARSSHDPDALTSTVRPLLRGLLVAAFVVPGIAAGGARPVMSAMFGPAAAEQSILLVGLSIAAPLRWGGSVLGVVLTATGRHSRRVTAATAALAGSLLVNVAFIPRFGPTAAVVAHVGSALLVTAVYLATVDAAIRRDALRLGARLVVAAVAGGVVAARAASHLPPVLEVTVFALVYAAVLLASARRDRLRGS